MRVLDVVATLREFPDQRVGKGQVGTVVDELDHDHVLVEFSDLDGVADLPPSAIPFNWREARGLAG